MKIFLLSEANSPHTIKWVTSLANRDIQIILFSITESTTEFYKKFDNIIVETGNIRFNESWIETRFSKLIYLKLVPLIKKLIEKHKPDILHAHYASSYGLLGALTNFHPLLISVWGSDVLTFPHTSFIHKKILQFILNKSSQVFATSHYLANKSTIFTYKPIIVIPFGVDLTKFNFIASKKLFNSADIVVGTIKSLEKTYGIDTLIKAFSLVKKINQELSLKLLIVGKGSEEKNLKALATELLNKEDYFFTGYIKPEIIREYHSSIDISVYLSNQESFGVSTLEAMASSKPVIVTNIGGLSEIVDHGENGFIVSPDNPEEAAIAIERLVRNPDLRIKLGKNGRDKIKSIYNWNMCVDTMIENYNEVLDNYNIRAENQ